MPGVCYSALRRLPRRDLHSVGVERREAADGLATSSRRTMLMIVIGAVALALPTVPQYRTMERMTRAYGVGERSVALIVAVIVSLVGILALVVTTLRG